MTPVPGTALGRLVRETTQLYAQAARSVRAGALDDAVELVGAATRLREAATQQPWADGATETAGASTIQPDSLTAAEAAELAGPLKGAVEELQQALHEALEKAKAEQGQAQKGLRQLGLLRNILIPHGAQRLDTRR